MRIFIALCGVLGALIAPPWVPMAAVVLLSVRWRAWEAPLIGLLIDFMWLPAGFSFSALPYYTLASLAIVWLFEPIRVRFLV